MSASRSVSAGAAAPSSSSPSAGQDHGEPRSPLLLPTSLSKKTFYLSPLSNPELVLAILIPGHPLYSGAGQSPTEKSAVSGAADAAAAAGGRLAHFFGSITNTVTNTAASAVGVKNQLELNKPRLKLVARPSAERADTQMNTKWLIGKEDGCVYSCVEEREGGPLYRLGLTKNQMVRVQGQDDPDGDGGEGGNGTPADSDQLDLGTPQEGAASFSTTVRDSSQTASGLVAMGKDSANRQRADGGSSSSKGQLISVTTAQGQTVMCPLRWRVASGKSATVAADSLRDLVAVSAVHVVIEDLEPVGGWGGASATSGNGNGSGNASGSSAGRDTSRLLVIKNVCCGNIDCELEKIDVGASCGFKEAALTTDEEKAAAAAAAAAGKRTPPSNSVSSALTKGTLTTRSGPNIKQVWRVESDFSMWIGTLSRSVSTGYSLTRKLQKIEEDRKKTREETPDFEPHVALKLTIDYEYSLIWSTEGTKAAAPLSIWRPRTAAGSFVGDFAHAALTPPTKKESVVVGAGLGGQQSLHRALVRPADFELVWSKKKGKHGNLFVWAPIAPPGVDALALGHVASTGKDEAAAKPAISCGVVMVLRAYLRDTGHALSNPLWNDSGAGGGVPGALWKASPTHTFFANPGTHQPPSGSYYRLLEAQEPSEKCPLLRPMETANVPWEPVWDDKNTLATMDVSVWRPKLSGTYVRFGDQIVRGHAAPKVLAIVARDHPAFRRPRGFELATKFYRGARKCYVYRPIPPDANYVALGWVVSPTKTEPPLPDCMRCVHREALVPLGALKQLWIEHHAGMMSKMSFGVTNLLTISRDYPVNMLWKNRSTNTFIAVQNAHSRPAQFAGGSVFRLTMTSDELAHVVSGLELHARWVLDSVALAMQGLEKMLVESNYRRLSVSPRQCAVMFQAVRGVFKLMRSPSPSSGGAGGGSEGSEAAFAISSSFRAYLSDYETRRLRSVERAVKRHLYQTICEDIGDHENTLEMLDESWELVKIMPDVHRVADEFEQWIPACPTVRFPSSQQKPLHQLILDDQIGREIFERFLSTFPPRVSARGMDEHDDADDDEPMPPLQHQGAAAAAAAKKAAASTPRGSVVSPSPRPASTSTTTANPDGSGIGEPQQLRRASSLADANAAAAQLEETRSTLGKLKTLSDDLDSVIGLTSSMELRKRYLEFYQAYITHTLLQEFPVSSSSNGLIVRSAASGHRLGMSSLLAVVSWVSAYEEVVALDLLEGDRAEARSVLGKLDELVDRLMDSHDDMAKEKILSWISNLLRQEERAAAELLEYDGDDPALRSKRFYYTSGPADLFLNINTLFDSQSASLSGRPLARVALVHVHVLAYYQQVQIQFLKQMSATNDGTTFDTVHGKVPPSQVVHAGSMAKPYAYILAQINNSRLYQANVEELSDRVIRRLGNDDAPDEVITSLEDAFSQCSEEFTSVSLAAAEVLIRHMEHRLKEPLSKLFTSGVWFADSEYLQSAVLDELDDMASRLVPNMEANICATHLLRETTKFTVRAYVRAFVDNLKANVQRDGPMSLAAVAERMRMDLVSIRQYCESCAKWDVLSAVERLLPKVEVLVTFLCADADFLQLHVKEVEKTFLGDTEFSPAVMLSCLLALRSDIASEERRAFLAPYAAEIKAIEARRAEFARAKAFSFVKTSPSSGGDSATAISPGGGSANIGGEAYGLDILLDRGTDLAVKDLTTSDPYVNVILLRGNGKRLDKQKSKVVAKNLNPVWSQHFSAWKPADVNAMDRVRFEVWDRDFISKDFMGSAEVSVGELRHRQLMERKASLQGDDYTQEALSFHLKLQPQEGKKNEGANLVSGYIDVKIRYFRLAGQMQQQQQSQSQRHLAPPGVGAGGKGAAPSSGDEIDFEPESTGQTGSKRISSSSSTGLSSAAPSSSSSLSVSVDSPTSSRSSSSVIQSIEASVPLWQSIVNNIKLAKSPTTGTGSTSGNGSSVVASASAACKRGTAHVFGVSRATAKNPFLVPEGDADSRASSRRGSAHTIDAAAVSSADSVIPAPIETRKKIDKKGSEKFNIFGLF